MAPKIITSVLRELGLTSLYHSSRDVKLLILQRFTRFFGYGSSTLIFAAFLSMRGISDDRIGLFMTLTILGDIVISFLLALVADGLGRRTILGIGASLMMLSGIVFAFADNYWVLLAAAVVGVISPNGNEIGPFRAVEESSLAHVTQAAERGEIIAWYLFGGSVGAALGMITSGWAIHKLQTVSGCDLMQAYRYIFIIYAICGLIKLLLTVTMSDKVEADPIPLKPAESGDETQALLPSKPEQKEKKQFRLWPQISRESVPIVINLCILFTLDAFGSGLASATWITYFFRRTYGLEEGKLGTLFFISNIIAALSLLVSSSITKRIGNIKTMVFTHLPSAICLSLIAVPTDVRLSMFFLLLRACTQSMDAAPRSAFVAQVLLPHERTAMYGTVVLIRTFGTSIGPLITGMLASKGLFWVAFITAGAVKALYDVGILATFLGHKVLAERGADKVSQKPKEQDGEQ